jgi:hypothetical protein
MGVCSLVQGAWVTVRMQGRHTTHIVADLLLFLVVDLEQPPHDVETSTKSLCGCSAVGVRVAS